VENDDFNSDNLPARMKARSFTPPAQAGDSTALVDCWSKVGVGGDGTCPELDKFFHCRNCPVYSAAAMRLLDRELPQDYRRQWTQHFALQKKRPAPANKSAVVFRIGPEWFALPTGVFREIAERRPIHSLPHRQQGVVLGLVNVRGELLICVSLGRLLGLERENPRHKPRAIYERLVVTEWQGRFLSFPVSEVAGIHRFKLEELKDAPAALGVATPQFIQKLLPWQNRQVNSLDQDLVFAALNRTLT
jgi:chemotaxis-related protein WspD